MTTDERTARKLSACRLAVAMVVAAAVLAGCGGSGVSASQVASAAGAKTCSDSGFYIQSKLTGNKLVIYDCRFVGRLPACVTYSGNIATNATVAVQFLFASSLGAREPACLSWLSAAKARRAAAREAARAQAYRQALSADAHAAWHAGFAADYSGIGAYQLPNIYYRFVNHPSSCAAYATNGCWKIEVVTRNGCPTALSIQMGEEESNGTQVGTAYGNTGSLYPRERAVIEIDATQSQAPQGRIGAILCD